MEKATIRKGLVVLWITGLTLVLAAGAAFAWEAATHAYIEAHLNKKIGQADSDVMNNRIYGANAIDIFNNRFTSPYLEFAAYLHDPSQENFLKAWQAATSREERAFAYGFVSHNNRWGMDSTAHVSGITYGRGTGYVIAKARLLAAMLKPSFEAQLGLQLPDETLVNLCHYLVESGVDFLIRAKDPAIGSKLWTAAMFRSDEVPALLVKAYRDEFAALAGSPEEAARIIAEAEDDFRASMMTYGWVLTQPEALDLVAYGLASIGVIYLGLPPGSELAMAPIAKQGIEAAMMLCKDDFLREIQATKGWVNGRLSSARIAW